MRDSTRFLGKIEKKINLKPLVLSRLNNILKSLPVHTKQKGWLLGGGLRVRES